MAKRNPWHKPLMRELRAGRLTQSEVARLAGVSRERVGQWCEAAGFDPAEARERRLALFYARELLRMGKRGKSVPFMAARVKRRPRLPQPSKTETRAATDALVIDFEAAGGKIVRCPPGMTKRKRRR